MAIELLAGLSSEWASFKDIAEQDLGVSGDVLHCIIGVVAQILIAAILRSSIDRWLPWLCVLAFELLNEANDLFVEIWPDFDRQLMEGGKDILITMALPTILLLVSRFSPHILVGRRRKRRAR